MNPGQSAKANLDGIAYVTTRMRWYCSLSEHLLSKQFIKLDVKKSFEDVVDKLEDKVVELYKKLLVFQMKSVCSYYQNQGWTFLKGILDLDGWAEMLASVKEDEAALEKDSDFYNKLESRNRLGQIVQNGQELQQTLGDFHQTLKDYILSQMSKEMDKEYQNCLKDLYKVNPQEQIEAIQGKSDTLLPQAYKWVLRTKEYQALTDWSDKSACRVLSLNGPAGTGKTMLTIGIISEICAQSSKFAPGISYFFCRSEFEDKNSANDALRALIWLLLMQQPHLASHLTPTHSISGASMFNSPTSFWSLVILFKKMLADERLTRAYLVIDALDECAEGKPGVEELIFKLISESLNENTSGKIKWIVSSRPEVEVHRKVNKGHPGAVFEIDVQSRPEPVNAYITHKLSEMKVMYDYRENYVEELDPLIRKRAQNTFLWAALVFKELAKVKDWEAVGLVKETPEKLTEQYAKMMTHIDKLRGEVQLYCKGVLEAACFASRPLSYQEVHILAGLPHQVPITDIIKSCGSFLVVQNETVHLLHNTTRQWLTDYFKARHEDGGAAQVHANMANNSIAAMSDGLRFNIYGLEPATELNNIKPPHSGDDLTPLRYSCEFWVDHLCKSSIQISDEVPAFAFLQAHFLHWLESLSLICKLPTALQSIRNLLKKTQVC